jgi:DNA-directed RNA polymerase specialized sigma24 family protein
MKDVGNTVVQDLAQEMYLRLVQHDGRILRSFRGDSDFSVRAFLARVASSVVQDYRRRMHTERRRGELVSIDNVRRREDSERPILDSPAFDSGPLSAILGWIDIERVIEGESDRKNARRNALIFKLHYIDGFEAAEIARFPGFDLTRSGVETVLARLRKRIQR